MPTETLKAEELVALVQRVFQPGPDDRALAVLIDLPDDTVADNDSWAERRQMASGWVRELATARREHGIDAALFAYRNVHSNNADLPATGWHVDHDSPPDSSAAAELAPAVELESVLAEHPLVLAPTEMSATAPLKMMAPRLGFRAATMPRFTAAMIPALRLDYTEVNRRVLYLKTLLDRATACDLEFVVDGDRSIELHLDLRHRSAHASGGLLLDAGTAGNLPSGEAYIVPYEGELPGDPSGTKGQLPIQHGDEVVVYEIDTNQVAGVASEGEVSSSEAARLVAEPAAGNLAELGLGVLADFGIQPIGEVLLDEKLGLHLALGRSEHFGGQVGPAQFSGPDAVVHQDHVYLEQLQPRILPARVSLVMGDDGSLLELMSDGQYVVDFGEADDR
jgi:leucyl aminopeptidase (aminopeptidase T)